VPDAALDRCLSVRELAKRWRVAPKKVRLLIRRGTLNAFDVGFGRTELRIPPEAIQVAEQSRLAVKPRPKRRQRLDLDPEIAAILGGES
jgi:hypothetical protein